MSEVNTPVENSEESLGGGIPEVTFTLEVEHTVPAPVDPTLTISGEAADAQATGLAIEAAKQALQTEIDATNQSVAAVAGLLFPVGAIYVSTSETAPTFGAANWNWQEIMIPVTQGDLMDGARSYAEKGSEDTPGTIHFWLRIADTEVSE